MKIKFLIKGLIRKIPGIYYLLNSFFHINKGGGESYNPRYCYAVWLRHLVLAWQNGYTALPLKVIEFGPGRTLGVGIMALISGAGQYYALDSIKLTNTRDNLKMFDELVLLLLNKSPIPNDEEFPNLKPALDNYAFPHHIFTAEHLKTALKENRLLKIKNAIKEIDHKNFADSPIVYLAPWNDTPIIKPQSVDMILSQSVMQYMPNLSLTFSLMKTWLKPNGLISHQIDLTSIGSSDTWYGHWEYTDREWKIAQGRKNYNINREPYSAYSKLLDKKDFQIINIIRGTKSREADRSKLASRFKNFTDEDISTASLFIQAVKNL